MLRRRGWLAGWLCVCPSHAGIVSKTAKPILKLFRPSGSTIILVSSDPWSNTQFQGELFQRGVKCTGGGKIADFRAIFDGNRRLSRKRREIGQWLLWNINRNHGCRIEWYHFRWPWVTLNPGFKVTVYLQVEHLKNGAF